MNFKVNDSLMCCSIGYTEWHCKKQYLQTGSKQQEKADQTLTFLRSFPSTKIFLPPKMTSMTETKFIFQNNFGRVTIEISCQMDFSQYPFDRWHIQRHQIVQLLSQLEGHNYFQYNTNFINKRWKSYLQKWRNNLQKIKRIDRILLQAYLLLPSWLL